MNEKTGARKAILSLIITFVLWGSLYVVSRYVLGKLGPFTISFARFVIAFLTLTLMLGKRRKPLEKGDIRCLELYLLLSPPPFLLGYAENAGCSFGDPPADEE